VCDDWTGKRPLPLDIAKAPAQYLRNLEHKLKLVSEYTTEHAASEQARYTQRYNLRSRDKSFIVGERLIYLMPYSTHKLTRTWIGPCVVVKKNSPYSYVIEKDDGKLQWCHANHLRKFNERVNEATVHNCAIIFGTDQDFGHVPTVDIQFNENTTSVITNSNTHVDSSEFDDVDSVTDYDEPFMNNSHGLYSRSNVDDVRYVVSVDIINSKLRIRLYW